MSPNRNKQKIEINAASVIPMTIFLLKFNGYINYKLSYLSVLCPCKNMTFKGELFLNKLRILRAKTTYTWYIHLFPNMQPLIQTAAATFRLDSLPLRNGCHMSTDSCPHPHSPMEFVSRKGETSMKTQDTNTFTETLSFPMAYWRFPVIHTDQLNCVWYHTEIYCTCRSDLMIIICARY